MKNYLNTLDTRAVTNFMKESAESLLLQSPDIESSRDRIWICYLHRDTEGDLGLGVEVTGPGDLSRKQNYPDRKYYNYSLGGPQRTRRAASPRASSGLEHYHHHHHH